MIRLRRGGERGHVNHGWLDSWHSFSFGDYLDRAHMGVSVLRVINEDIINGGEGFPTHPHSDMEIITYMLSGSLAHRDSMGNSSIIRRGEIQRMTAGSGITHSEFNASEREPAHLLQIWLHPDAEGLTPGYQQVGLSWERMRGKLCLLASPLQQEGGVVIHQDAAIYAALVDGEEQINYRLARGGRSTFTSLRGS